MEIHIRSRQQILNDVSGSLKQFQNSIKMRGIRTSNWINIKIFKEDIELRVWRCDIQVCSIPVRFVFLTPLSSACCGSVVVTELRVLLRVL
jgi:hypothetical protein